MKRSELKEIIKASMLEDMGTSPFLENKPERIEDFINSLDNLIEEYHADLYLNDELFTAIDAVKRAAKQEMGREDEMGDIPVTITLDNLGLEEAKKDEEEEEVEDVEVDAEEDITLDEPEEEEMDMEPESDTSGLDAGEKDLQNNLEKALEAAKEMGDDKLAKQIGNTITFFTRTHVVGDAGNVEEVEVEEVELNEGYTRMQKLAGIIK